jgi:hypothetical protein
MAITMSVRFPAAPHTCAVQSPCEGGRGDEVWVCDEVTQAWGMPKRQGKLQEQETCLP